MKESFVVTQPIKRAAITLLLFVAAVGLVLEATGALSAAGAANGEEQAYVPVVVAEEGGIATATPTLELTLTATATATSTPTAMPSATPTQTATPSITPTSTKTPPPTKTPKPTQTPSPGEERLVFDWNTVVQQWNDGFMKNKPPLENGDWTTPINFAEGTLYLRAEVRDIPVSQPDMKISYCYWQNGELSPGVPFYFETCTTKSAPGVDGQITTWSAPIPGMWKLEGYPLDWSKPRTESGFVIKAGNGIPVSNKKDFNWGCGNDPECVPNPGAWYPMDIRFTVVVVEKGAGFSGWNNYIP
jgi:hypothetical protein